MLRTPQGDKEEGARAKALGNSFLVRGVAVNKIAPLKILTATCMLQAESQARTRTRTNTNPNDTEANAAGRSGNARALRKTKQVLNNSRWGGALAKSLAESEVFVGVATPQGNKEEGARAKTLRNSFLVRGVAVNRKAPPQGTNNNMQAGRLWP